MYKHNCLYNLCNNIYEQYLYINIFGYITYVITYVFMYFCHYHLCNVINNCCLFYHEIIIMFIKIDTIDEFIKSFGEYIADKDYRIYSYTNKYDSVWDSIIGFEVFYYNVFKDINDNELVTLTIDTIYDNPEIYVIDITDRLFNISIDYMKLFRDIKLYLENINNNNPFVQEYNTEVLRDL